MHHPFASSVVEMRFSTSLETNGLTALRLDLGG
jgi:hypothetical protein